MEIATNTFKRALAERRRQVGLWSQVGHPTVTEILGDARPDWVLIDTEHAPIELPTVMEQLRVLERSGVAALVRPAWNDAVLFKRLLDSGAQTLLVPYVQSAEEARRAVAATRYPPEGIRGVAVVHRANRYGRVDDYPRQAARELCVLVQIETKAAADRLEEIAGVEGVDGVFIGPSDLAAALGHLGDNRHPEVRAAIEGLCARAVKEGTPIGILATVEADAKAFFEMGFSYVAVASDLGLFRKATDDIVAKFK